MAKINLGNIRTNWRGAYSSSDTYNINDMVSYQGSSYICVTDATTGVTPTHASSEWDLAAHGVPPFTTKGDMAFYTGTQTTNLGIGTAHQGLYVSESGIPEWRDQGLDPQKTVKSLCSAVDYPSAGYSTGYLMADGSITMSGDGNQYNNSDLSSADWYAPRRINVDGAMVKFKKVFFGRFNNYAIDSEDFVWSWGRNGDGELGHGNTTNVALAKRIQYFVTNNIKVKDIVPALGGRVGQGYACVFFHTTDNKLYACGNNNYGQLGDGTTTTRNTPVRVSSLVNVKKAYLCAYPSSSFMVDTQNRLWAWGYNGNGGLGIGDTTNRSSPTLVTGMTNVKKVAIGNGTSDGGTSNGEGFTLVVKNDGTLWGSGQNRYGQLGLGNTTQYTSFQQVTSLSGVKDVVASRSYYGCVCALLDTKQIRTWGYNGNYQLGDTTTTVRNSPITPTAFTAQGKVDNIQVIGGTTNLGFILQTEKDANGVSELWACGYCDNGQIGLGTENIRQFTKIPNISGKIKDWKPYGHDATSGIAVLYEDGRVDWTGSNASGMGGFRDYNDATYAYYLSPVRF